MTTGIWIELFVAALTFVIVMLSAWVETSLATVTRVNLRALLEGRFSRLPERELEGPQYTRSSMLLIEMIGVGISTALIAHVAWQMNGSYGLWVGIAIATFLHVVLGRIVPRILVGDERSEQSATQARVARGLAVLFSPVIRPVDALVNVFLARRGAREIAESASDDTGDSQPSNSAGERDTEETDEIEPVEREMISGVLHLEDSTASQIMVPRIDIVAINLDATIEEMTAVVIEAGHSRIPVYGQNIDEIQGIVYAKDLLRYVVEDTKGVSLETLLRPCYYVPESKRVDDLLRELQQTRVHMAVVVDEYGGTAGVVTIEDILEEIVGEIEDEYDTEQPYIEIISDTEAIVAGKVSVEDFMDDLQIHLPSATGGTIGGFVQHELGRIPKQGETLQIDNVRLTVMEVEHRRIRQVKVERLAEEEKSPHVVVQHRETGES
ncbi:MAG: HlyC/CorC family transporter [Chloroflexia bacterium]|nr:HlyC/CorC family transporter [Chloroflexia bacterium]